MRIGTNYARMFIGLALGIILIQIMLASGEGVYAAIALTGSSIGVAEIMKEMIRGATIPELGNSYHSGNAERFRSTYAAAFALSLIAAGFSALILSLFFIFLGQLDTSPDLFAATRIFIVTRMVSTFCAIALSPVLNMMPLRGRMGAYNAWLTADRVAETSAALAAFYFYREQGGAAVLTAFAILSMILMTASTLGAAKSASGGNELMRPRLSLVSGQHLRTVFSTVGWNGLAVISVNLYLRFDVFAVNLFFGQAGTVMFGLASQLAAYTRTLTMGIVSGLDAVVTAQASRKDAAGLESIRRLSAQTFELQALILLAAGAFLFLHSHDIIRLLFGWRITAETEINMIALSFLLLMAGMIARGLSEGWMSVLAGTGHIRNYALPVFIGSLLNPLAVMIAGYSLTYDKGFLSVSIVFMVLNFIFHMGAVPAVAARVLQTSLNSLLRPLVLPAALAIILAGGLKLLIPDTLGPISSMAVSAIAIGLVMGTLALRSLRALLRLAS